MPVPRLETDRVATPRGPEWMRSSGMTRPWARRDLIVRCEAGMESLSREVAEKLVERRRHHCVCGLVDVEERWV